MKTKYPSKPMEIKDKAFRYDSFDNGKPLYNKKKNRLPAMGWNSWNAFGSGNTEALTKAMADRLVELGLDKLGYKFVVLDDGCYKSERIEGKLSNDEVKFPSGFLKLSDYVHSKGLKFGMYNDIGTNLCAGAEVGTCGHEKIDAKSYIDWKVDFLKIDNCYYLWDNATFSNPENARYVFAPKIKGIKLCGNDFEKTLSVSKNGKLTGLGGNIQQDFVYNIGTFDGTNTGTTPVGPRSSEIAFEVEAPSSGNYNLFVDYATSKENGIGQWLQIAVENACGTEYFYDDFLPESPDKDTFVQSDGITLSLLEGKNTIRLMNHRRQENTLCSYAAMLEGLNEADFNHNITLSLCEWGKTMPQNWGYKVGDSWRILNDITFRVGSDGNPGYGAWSDPGTPSVTSQYNKCVIMDEFAGLDKGWNDPDMLMIGMTGLTETMNKTHFAMWCMMNSPLMLGLDLRRLDNANIFTNIISNIDLIALNQDELGIQAKRIWTDYSCKNPDTEYIQDNNRTDMLVKPLSDDNIAVSVFNLREKEASGQVKIDLNMIKKVKNLKLSDNFNNSKAYSAKDLWSKAEFEVKNGEILIDSVEPCGNVTLKIFAK